MLRNMHGVVIGIVCAHLSLADSVHVAQTCRAWCTDVQRYAQPTHARTVDFAEYRQLVRSRFRHLLAHMRLIESAPLGHMPKLCTLRITSLHVGSTRNTFGAPIAFPTSLEFLYVHMYSGRVARDVLRACARLPRLTRLDAFLAFSVNTELDALRECATLRVLKVHFSDRPSCVALNVLRALALDELHLSAERLQHSILARMLPLNSPLFLEHRIVNAPVIRALLRSPLRVRALCIGTEHLAHLARFSALRALCIWMNALVALPSDDTMNILRNCRGLEHLELNGVTGGAHGFTEDHLQQLLEQLPTLTSLHVIGSNLSSLRFLVAAEHLRTLVLMHFSPFLPRAELAHVQRLTTCRCVLDRVVSIARSTPVRVSKPFDFGRIA